MNEYDFFIHSKVISKGKFISPCEQIRPKRVPVYFDLKQNCLGSLSPMNLLRGQSILRGYNQVDEVDMGFSTNGMKKEADRWGDFPPLVPWLMERWLSTQPAAECKQVQFVFTIYPLLDHSLYRHAFRVRITVHSVSDYIVWTALRLSKRSSISLALQLFKMSILTCFFM